MKNIKEVAESNKENFSFFLKTFEQRIRDKIGMQRLEAPLSQKKINTFINYAREIIHTAFMDYIEVFKIGKISFEPESSLQLQGQITLIPKIAFTENDTQYISASIFPDAIVNQNIKHYIPNSFLIGRTNSYLVDPEMIIKAIERVKGNETQILIVGVDIQPKMKEILNNSVFKNIVKYIPSSGYYLNDVLFILKEQDLPFIDFLELPSDQITANRLEKIDTEFNVYASVVDINQPENADIKERWKVEFFSDPEDLKVQIAVLFSTNIHWKKERRVVQLNVTSPFKEQGIQNDLHDIIPLDSK